MIPFKEFVIEAKAKVKLIDHGYRMEFGHIEAKRYMKSRGDSFSGWIVSNTHDRGDYTDPISSREQAKKIMRQWYDEDVASGKYKGHK
jgi:hypothetical protein